LEKVENENCERRRTSGRGIREKAEKKLERRIEGRSAAAALGASSSFEFAKVGGGYMSESYTREHSKIWISFYYVSHPHGYSIQSYRQCIV
jgi:hypothetical protein